MAEMIRVKPVNSFPGDGEIDLRLTVFDLIEIITSTAQAAAYIDGMHSKNVDVERLLRTDAIRARDHSAKLQRIFDAYVNERQG
jgi:hypothetical protein